MWFLMRYMTGMTMICNICMDIIMRKNTSIAMNMAMQKNMYMGMNTIIQKDTHITNIEV